MVHVTGTATDFNDLWTKFTNELTSNTDLVNAGENWSQVWTDGGDEFVFEGPGIAGAGKAYVGIRRVADANGNIFEWQMYGMTGYNAAATDLSQHVQVSPMVRLLLNNSDTTWWLTVNGRRFVLVVRISTYYEACYGGFFLPFLTPQEYPYPCFIGAAAMDGTDADIPVRWNDATAGHRLFTDPQRSDGRSAHVLDPSRIWRAVDDYGGSSGNDSATDCHLFPNAVGKVWQGTDPAVGGTRWMDADDEPDANWVIQKLHSCLGGGNPLWPLAIFRSDGSAVYGRLEGVYRAPVYNAAAETTVTINGVNHICFPNVWRQDATDLWALEAQ